MLQYSGGQHSKIIIFLQLVPQLSLGEVISAYIVSICLMRLKIDYGITSTSSILQNKRSFSELSNIAFESYNHEQGTEYQHWEKLCGEGRYIQIQSKCML